MTTDTTSTGAARVVIVDHHLMVAEALAAALGLGRHDCAPVCPPDGLPAADQLSWVLQEHPRVVLLDLELGRAGEGMAMIEPLVRAGVAVIGLTGASDPAHHGRAVSHGVAKVHSRADTLADIRESVLHVIEGLPLMTAAERDALVREWDAESTRRRSERHLLGSLSARECQVLDQLMTGRSVREICQADVVSEATVRTQVRSILGKLEVSSQLAAVALARQIGWRAGRSPERESGAGVDLTAGGAKNPARQPA